MRESEKAVSEAMKTSPTVELGDFATQALAGGEADMERVPARVVRAIRYYLCDSHAGRAEWPYPGFLPGRDGSGGEVELELKIDESVWASFEAEAERQGASTPQLVEHAALYYAADRDAGRVTQRILDDLDDE